MNLLATCLRWTMCAALTLPAAVTAAADLDPEMRAALRQLVDAHRLEPTVPALLDNARLRGIEQARQGAAQAIAGNPDLGEVERARARRIMEELAPQLAAGVDADLRKIDLDALTLGMVEAVYPKYYSAQEVRHIAAHLASPGYRKMLEAMHKVQQEYARTGGNKEQLWRMYTSGISMQEQREVAAFMASPLGQKMKLVGDRVRDDSSAYVQSKLGPVVAATVAAQRKLFLEKLAQAQTQ